MTPDLSQRRLRLTADLESRTLRDGSRWLKQTRCAEYLALPPAVAALPELFTGERTVGEILGELLRQEVHPGIREYYDFVLGAERRGFLEVVGSDTVAPPTRKGRRWGVAWRGIPAVASALAFIPIGLAAFWTTAPGLPATLGEWGLALWFVVLLLSLAHLLAGCVLSGFGRQVYGAGIHARNGLPYFSIDGRDAFMSGRSCQAVVALQALAVPFAAAAAAVALESPPLFLAATLSALALACPLGSTPAHDLLFALFRRQYQLPRCTPLVLQRKLLTQLFARRGGVAEEEYLLGYSLAVVLWLGCLIRVAGGLVQRESDAFVRDLLFAPEWSMRLSAFAAIFLLAALLLVPVLYQLLLGLRNLHALLAPHWSRAECAVTGRRGRQPRPAAADVHAFLRNTLLFKGLPEPELARLAAAMAYVEVPPGTTLIREGDHGDTLFIVYDGTVAVLKENAVGEPEPVATLGAGDVFGEIALLENTPRTASVHSRTRAALLTLQQKDFERLVVAALGAETVKTTIQVTAFLKRHSLFAGWPDRALTELAHEFITAGFRAGDVLVRAGEPMAVFHLLYEGRVEVRRQGVAGTELGPGEFFGESGLLRGTPAPVDVVALTAGRCLKLGKASFLAFVSRDFGTGLAVEAGGGAERPRPEGSL